MTNILWIIFILGGIIIALLTGNIDNIGSIILNSTNDAFNIFLKLSLMIFMWNGIFNILFETGIIKLQPKKKKSPDTLKFSVLEHLSSAL